MLDNTTELTDEIAYIILKRIDNIQSHQLTGITHEHTTLYNKKTGEPFNTLLAGKLEKIGLITNVIYADNDLYSVTITEKGHNYLKEYENN